MSKNLAQIFAANPITTIGATDLLYVVTTGTTDAAIDGTHLLTAISPLTTKGDLFTFSTVNARLAVGGTNGQILQVNSAAAVGLAWSTATYPATGGASGNILISNGTNYISSTSLWPNTVGSAGKIIRSDGTTNAYSTSTFADTYTASNLLYSNGSNTVTGLATANNGLLVTSNTGVPSILAGPGTTGNILQSNAAAAPSFSTATFPSVATSTGSFLYANGTNWVASTSLWVNTVGSAGKIIRSDGTTNTYSTSTFADTYAVSTILYASSANAVSGLATANSAVLVTNSTGVPAWSGTMTNGQVIIGSTGATPTAATLTAGTGISITNGAASITIAGTTNGLTYNDVSGTSQAAAVNNGYIISNAAQTTVTLPATAAEGSVIAVQGKGAAGWILTANTGQIIHLGSSASSSAGSLTSTNQWDTVTVVCVTANTTWAASCVIGNLTVS